MWLLLLLSLVTLAGENQTTKVWTNPSSGLYVIEIYDAEKENPIPRIFYGRPGEMSEIPKDKMAQANLPKRGLLPELPSGNLIDHFDITPEIRNKIPIYDQ